MPCKRSTILWRYCNLLIGLSYKPQYIKQETLIVGPNGKEARATRLITERASRRIGQMAFETALARGANVSSLYSFNHKWLTLKLPYSHY